MPVSVKVSGAWKQAAAVYNKVSSSWKTASDMPVKVSGVWKTGILESGAFESIATATITGSSGTIIFSSIPSTYKHLQIRYNGRTTAAQTNTQLYVSYNSITSGYANHLLGGNGTTAETNNDINGSYMIMYNAVSGASATADIMGNGIIDIIDYASTSKNKTLRATIGTDRNGQGNIWLISGLMNNTAAVSSVNLTLGSGNWTTDSTVALYGIKGS